MGKRTTVYRRAYYVLTGIPVAYSYLMLLSRRAFWPTYWTMVIGWGVGLLVAYFFDAYSGKPALPYAKYHKLGQFINIGRNMDENLWCAFGVEAVIFSVLGIFTSGFFRSLLAFFLSIGISMLYCFLIYVLPVPIEGQTIFTPFSVNPSPGGYVHDPNSRFNDGFSVTYSDGVRGPANTEYLSGYPGRTWREKHDNWLNR